MTEENQYLELINDILEKGSTEQSRNGIVREVFGRFMRFSLKNGSIPLITTKQLAWKTCFKELCWFLKGSTNNQELQDVGVHIWDGNASKEYLESRNGLKTELDGDLGPIYGHQWRHFNAPYENCNTDYTGKGIDQIENLIRNLSDPTKRSSRRHIISAWNPQQLDEMALPPCHILAQFNVRNGKYLSCALYQRSGDVGLGVPFNIASYSFLTHILAKHCGLEAEDFVYVLGSAHIYEEHIEQLKEQVQRTSYPFPKINILNKHDNITDYALEDIEWLEEYKCHKTIKMKMCV